MTSTAAPAIHAKPYTDDCAHLLDNAEHALIGLSVWNSQFTPHRVEAIIEWAARVFARLDVVIPSYEAAYTRIAAGHSPVRAVRPGEAPRARPTGAAQIGAR